MALTKISLTHRAYTTNTDAAAKILSATEAFTKTFIFSLPVGQFMLEKGERVYTGKNINVPVTFTVNNAKTAQMLTDARAIMNDIKNFIRIDNLIEVDGKFQLNTDSKYLLSRGVSVQVGNIEGHPISAGYYDVYPNSDGTILKIGVPYTIPQRGPVFIKETSIGRVPIVITITTKTEEESYFINQNLSRIIIDNLILDSGVLYQDSSRYPLIDRGVVIQVFKEGEKGAWVNNKGYYEKNFKNHGGTTFKIDKIYIPAQPK